MDHGPDQTGFAVIIDELLLGRAAFRRMQVAETFLQRISAIPPAFKPMVPVADGQDARSQHARDAMLVRPDGIVEISESMGIDRVEIAQHFIDGPGHQHQVAVEQVARYRYDRIRPES